MDSLIQMQELYEYLSIARKEFKKRGLEYAKAYTNYRKLLAMELLKLKAEGMPATIVSDIARGQEEVANAKRIEIETECLYRSCQEAINTYKLQIKVLQEQIKNELGGIE